MENKNPLQQIVEGYGALQTRFAVLNLFCQSLIPALNKSQRDAVEAAFRSSVDQLLAISDEIPKAAVHHHDGLQVANALFAEFERQRRARDADAGG